jgi:hypothetical protein
MADKLSSLRAAVSCPKEELCESLELLISGISVLKNFVEITLEEISAPETLSKDDVQALISATEEIHDAAAKISVNANEIKQKLERFGK